MKEFTHLRVLRLVMVGAILLSGGGMIFPQAAIAFSPAIGSINSPEAQSPKITASPISATEYQRIGQILYAQALGGVQGLAVAGINTAEGDTNATDMIMVGTTGSGSWRGLQGYYANESTSLAKMMNDNDDAVCGMVKYVDPQDNNSKIIYTTQGTDTGTLVRQEAADITYEDGVTVYDDGKTPNFGSPLVSICGGNFDDDDDLEVAALGTDGKVVGITNLQNPSVNSANFYQFQDGSMDTDYRKFHTLLAPIPNLDASGPAHNDMIVGYYTFIAAISTNFSVSNALIWLTDVGSRIGSVGTISDMTGDGIPEVIASSYSGLYLLNGSDGALLWENTSIGSTFRDLIVFNDINNDSFPEVMTGNWDGEVLIFDLNLTSPTFGDLLVNTSLSTGQITRFLQLEDITGDGVPEYAVGGTGITGVLYGNNASWYWKKSVIGSGYWLNPYYIKVYDMALLADQNNDGYRDFAVTGAYETLDSGVFIYNSKGILEPVSTDDTTSDDSTSDDSSTDDTGGFSTIANNWEFFGFAAVVGSVFLVWSEKKVKK